MNTLLHYIYQCCFDTGGDVVLKVMVFQNRKDQGNKDSDSGRNFPDRNIFLLCCNRPVAYE